MKYTFFIGLIWMFGTVSCSSVKSIMSNDNSMLILYKSGESVYFQSNKNHLQGKGFYESVQFDQFIVADFTQNSDTIKLINGYNNLNISCFQGDSLSDSSGAVFEIYSSDYYKFSTNQRIALIFNQDTIFHNEKLEYTTSRINDHNTISIIDEAHQIQSNEIVLTRNELKTKVRILHNQSIEFLRENYSTYNLDLSIHDFKNEITGRIMKKKYKSYLTNIFEKYGSSFRRKDANENKEILFSKNDLLRSY